MAMKYKTKMKIIIDELLVLLFSRFFRSRKYVVVIVGCSFQFAQFVQSLLNAQREETRKKRIVPGLFL